MKRTELKRTDSLKRGKRRKPPLRRVVIVESEKPRVRLERDDRPVRWSMAVRGLPCAACRSKAAVEAHHIIRVQVLRRYAVSNGYDFDDVQWDGRNRLGLCRDCHANHHAASRKLPRELLWHYARWVFEFADELGLGWVLDHDYPEEVAA